ncbi:L-ascorbate metabolism protein UlaG, beta-lactamase superfamily [Microterricola viridarii]|uniref:L-ascorbate metabolism protein UlaG, beta-lactamase superfamily n=2 Tax=Microterricola viridarii TaxID=412690 RepID=A0A1H1SMF1_9MICO|nr:L-ascorbate metabolism protein UlaG, beta-lactamase superfamily [Microterricola viridarii]
MGVIGGLAPIGRCVLRLGVTRCLLKGMRITKLEHAAVIIENAGETLIIDPGKFTRPIEPDASVVAVVITHLHDDHWTPEQLERIRAASPGVALFGPAGVVAAAAAAGIPVQPVAAGDSVVVGGFELRFFGGTHALIHRSIPLIDNVGVLVNGRFYYGGDSFDAPADTLVEVLAVPAAAPWMKLSEAMDYVEAVAPRHSFPTHEMLLSDAGKALSNARLAWSTEQAGGQFSPLTPGESIEI